MEELTIFAVIVGARIAVIDGDASPTHSRFQTRLRSRYRPRACVTVVAAYSPINPVSLRAVFRVASPRGRESLTAGRSFQRHPWRRTRHRRCMILWSIGFHHRRRMCPRFEDFNRALARLKVIEFLKADFLLPRGLRKRRLCPRLLAFTRDAVASQNRLRCTRFHHQRSHICIPAWNTGACLTGRIRFARVV